jgi:hypothetical protein
VAQLGKVLVIVGLGLACVGALFWVGERLGLGRLPGDVHVRGKNFVFEFPIVTSILVSIVLTVVLNLWFQRR